MPCPGQPAIAPPGGPAVHRKSDTNDVSKGTKAPSPGKGLIAVSGSQAASPMLEGAGQDALSVNTWNQGR